MRQIGHTDYGLNMAAYKSGAAKLGLTIENYASGDRTAIWFDQVAPRQF